MAYKDKELRIAQQLFHKIKTTILLLYQNTRVPCFIVSLFFFANARQKTVNHQFAFISENNYLWFYYETKTEHFQLLMILYNVILSMTNVRWTLFTDGGGSLYTCMYVDYFDVFFVRFQSQSSHKSLPNNANLCGLCFELLIMRVVQNTFL